MIATSVDSPAVDATAPDGALSILAQQAAAAPEEPWAFYRGERGQFRWWSRARAIEAMRAGADARPGGVGEAAAQELVARLAAAGPSELAAARALTAALGPGPERDVWISWRPLAAEFETVLLVAAQLGGWAIVREPSPTLHPLTFAWARPTLLAGPCDELLALFDGFAAAAPRTLPQRWMRRRLARLRALIPLGDEAGAAAVEDRVTELGGRARRIDADSLRAARAGDEGG